MNCDPLAVLSEIEKCLYDATADIALGKNLPHYIEDIAALEAKIEQIIAAREPSDPLIPIVNYLGESLVMLHTLIEHAMILD